LLESADSVASMISQTERGAAAKAAVYELWNTAVVKQALAEKFAHHAVPQESQGEVMPITAQPQPSVGRIVASHHSQSINFPVKTHGTARFGNGVS
jgi:hypothetical protein